PRPPTRRGWPGTVTTTRAWRRWTVRNPQGYGTGGARRAHDGDRIRCGPDGPDRRAVPRPAADRAARHRGDQRGPPPARGAGPGPARLPAVGAGPVHRTDRRRGGPGAVGGPVGAGFHLLPRNPPPGLRRGLLVAARADHPAAGRGQHAAA